MRFVRFETTVSKVLDENVRNPTEIIAILNILKDKELDCAMRLSEGPKWSLCRILGISEKTFDFKVIQNRNVLLKTASIDEIEYLEVNVIDCDMAILKPRITRWFLLSAASELDDELE